MNGSKRIKGISSCLKLQNQFNKTNSKGRNPLSNWVNNIQPISQKFKSQQLTRNDSNIQNMFSQQYLSNQVTQSKLGIGILTGVNFHDENSFHNYTNQTQILSKREQLANNLSMNKTSECFQKRYSQNSQQAQL